MFPIHPLDLHDWTCYFPFSYVPPAKYAKIRCSNLHEKYEIKGKLVKNPYEYPYARPSSTANGNLEQKNYAEIEEDDKKFRWISVIHMRRVERCQRHQEKWTEEFDGCNVWHSGTAWMIWQLISGVGRSRSLRMGKKFNMWDVRLVWRSRWHQFLTSYKSWTLRFWILDREATLCTSRWTHWIWPILIWRDG